MYLQVNLCQSVNSNLATKQIGTEIYEESKDYRPQNDAE